jgi:SpoVK/Ycf46/Vps4 family AAA+-type ATPase
MTSRTVARLALDRGWSVFYLPDARGLETTLRLAQANGPAVLIAEDIDRYLGGERDARVDRILNALDGLDRSAQVVFVATSNAPDTLPAALLRPGRLDSCLIFGAPDAEAAATLIRRALGERAPADMSGVGEAAEGLLPASLREIASRSVLHAVARGSEDGKVSADDLIGCARSVRIQQLALEASEHRRPAIPVLGIMSMQVPNGTERAERDGFREPHHRTVDPAGIMEVVRAN